MPLFYPAAPEALAVYLPTTTSGTISESSSYIDRS
jgi:hypothetical protein